MQPAKNKHITGGEYRTVARVIEVKKEKEIAQKKNPGLFFSTLSYVLSSLTFNIGCGNCLKQSISLPIHGE